MIREIWNLPTARLHEIVDGSEESDETIEAAWDELDRREFEKTQPQDTRESDYYAAKSDLYEMWRNEY